VLTAPGILVLGGRHQHADALHPAVLLRADGICASGASRRTAGR